MARCSSFRAALCALAATVVIATLATPAQAQSCGITESACGNGCISATRDCCPDGSSCSATETCVARRGSSGYRCCGATTEACGGDCMPATNTCCDNLWSSALGPGATWWCPIGTDCISSGCSSSGGGSSSGGSSGGSSSGGSSSGGSSTGGSSGGSSSVTVSSSSSTTAIIGAAVGVAVAAVGVAAGLFWFWNKKKAKAPAAKDSRFETDSPPTYVPDRAWTADQYAPPAMPTAAAQTLDAVAPAAPTNYPRWTDPYPVAERYVAPERPAYSVPNPPQQRAGPNLAMAPLPANRRKLVRESDVHVEWAVALGEGGFGKVFAGQFQFMDVAVKVAKDRSTSGGSPGSSTSSTRSLADEIKVWGELSPHDHVVPLIGYCNESRLMIITKLYKGGNLLTYLSRQSPAYDLGLSVKLLAQTAAGLSFIHSQVPRMLHGDLKAENVLVDVPEGGGDPIAKIADFGLAKEGASMDSSGHFASANASSSARFSSPAGATLRFAPPEFFNSAGFSRASDVWTFGMLAYEVLSGGNPPYHNVPNWDVPNKIRAGETPTKPARVPHDLWNIVRSCWKREASQRPPASDIARRLFSLAEQPEYRPRRT